MNFRPTFISLLVLIFFAACSSNPSDPIPEEVIEDPIATTLIFPENNTECNEGTILSETQSKVNFRWNASEHTDSYEVVLKNTQNDSSSNFDANTNSKEITLERGTNYEWFVISKSIKSQVTATSETFQFFNAAPGEVNHVPFSAEAIAPENNSEVTSTSGKVNLQWEATDIDDDIKDYEIFFGTNKDQLTSLGIVMETSLEVEVTSGTAYFWKVNTNDETNNSSSSEIFGFTVR